MKQIAIFASILAALLASCASAGNGGGAGTAAAPEAAEAAAVPSGPAKESVKTKEQVFFAAGSPDTSWTQGALNEYTVYEWDASLSRLLKETRYTASGAALEKIEYSFKDDSSNPAAKITRIPSTEKDPRNPNRLVEQDQIRTQVEYEYDQGRVSKETMKSKDGKVISVYEYKYDAAGNLASRVWNNGKGVKMAEMAYTYAGGKLDTMDNISGSAGNKISSVKYEYDDRGNLVKQTSSSAGGKLVSVLTMTWQNGYEMKSERTGADNAVQQRETNEYGPEGDLRKKIIENVTEKSAQIVIYENKFK